MNPDPQFASLFGLWGLLAASLALSTLAFLISIVMFLRRHRPSKPAAPEPAMMPDAPRQMLQESMKNGRDAYDPLVSWTPDTLRRILATELPDEQVILVSNREPYIHNLGQDGKVFLCQIRTI